MKKFVLVICTVLTFTGAFAQKITIYHTIANEYIFSYGIVKNYYGNQEPSVLRFSGFLNMQYQLHFDFTTKVGIYTGAGIRNVGLITEPSDSGKLKLKQRAYGVNVPLAVKLGNMSKRSFIFAGAAAEYFFNYKEKIFVNNTKTKNNLWFSDKVTPFNPSVFLGFQHKGFFVVAKYYLLNFLSNKDTSLLDKNVAEPGYSQSSQLFYIGIGFTIKGGSSVKPNTVTPPKKASA